LKDKKKNNRFPLRKREISSIITRGDFIIVGGRKTSGKALLFYICNFTPHSKKINAKKQGTPLM
jgi:hypothetical protein